MGKVIHPALLESSAQTLGENNPAHEVIRDLEPEHPVRVLFTWYPWLGGLPYVRYLFYFLLRTFGESLRLARVNGYLGAAESLHAQEIRWLLDRFQQEGPTHVIDRGWRCISFQDLYRRALAEITDAKEMPWLAGVVPEAREQTLLTFCQLLLALEVSPTAP